MQVVQVLLILAICRKVSGQFEKKNEAGQKCISLFKIASVEESI